MECACYHKITASGRGTLLGSFLLRYGEASYFQTFFVNAISIPISARNLFAPRLELGGIGRRVL